MRSANDANPSSVEDGPLTPSVVVELCGLPGAGKSHLAAELLRALERREIPARAGASTVAPDVPAPRRVGRKLLAAGGQGLEHPVVSLRTTARIATATRAVPDAASRSLQWLVTQRLLARARRRPGVHVFDEGLLQALWSIGSRGDAEDLLCFSGAGDRSGIGRRVGIEPWVGADIVVAVAVSLEVALDRMDRRSSHHSRIERLPAATRAAELRRGETLLERLLEWWSAAAPPGSELVRISNDGSIEGTGVPTPGIVDVVRRVAIRAEPPT